MGKRPPQIVKSTGEVEPFRQSKLTASLRRAGASPADVRRVVAALRDTIRDGTTTKELYRRAHTLLRRGGQATAARYSLQRAIQVMGPGGYPFELLVGALWREEGYAVDIGTHLQGRYVRHEIDLLATRGKHRDLAECKFRNAADGKVDVKVAMYVYGRATDLAPPPRLQQRFWLITNGRFTSDALAFGEGMGLRMLSWDHPRDDGLRERIDRAGLHPITALTALRQRDKQWLLDRGVVLCRELCEQPALLRKLDLSPSALRRTRAEAEQLAGR